MLLAIMVIYYNVGTTDFNVLSLNDFSAGAQKKILPQETKTICSQVQSSINTTEKGADCQSDVG